ncbi:odorant receptor 318 [Tribolium castaneum]|uniref:Odorant receptor n=1 Tax=Tribolium castaneum TaxID=7070 RepID=D6X4L3_TRICA|nr:odorant receptor 318 [Tribolium castaneum]
MTQTDVLHLIKFLTNDIFRSKIAKIFLLSSTIFSASVTLIHSYFMLFRPNLREFSLKAPMFFGFCYPFLAGVVLLFENKLIENIPKQVKSGPIDQKLRKKIKTIKLYVIFVMISAVLAGLSYVQNVTNEAEIAFALQFFLDFVPNYYTFLAVCYKVSLFLMAVIAIIHPMQGIYAIEHMKIQVILLQKHVKMIEKKAKSGKDVETTLKFCIKRHINFLNFAKKLSARLSFLIAILVACGCVILMAISVFMLSGSFSPDYTFRITATSLETLATFVGVLKSGQELEDEIDKLGQILCTLDWYSFNCKNRKLYLIFLMNAMKPFKLKSLESYAINYQIGLSAVFTVISFTSQMHSKLYKNGH